MKTSELLAQAKVNRKEKKEKKTQAKKKLLKEVFEYHTPEVPRYILGIDPGLQGAMAVLDRQQMRVVYVEDCPLEQGGITKKARQNPASRTYAKKQMLNMLQTVVRQYGIATQVFIERSQVMSRGGVQQGSVSNFTIGYGYGLWDMALAAVGFPNLWTITPIEWAKRLYKDTSFLEIEETKIRSIAYVKHFFPDAPLIPNTPRHRVERDGRADAICIATYGLQHYMTTYEQIIKE